MNIEADGARENNGEVSVGFRMGRLNCKVGYVSIYPGWRFSTRVVGQRKEESKRAKGFQDGCAASIGNESKEGILGGRGGSIDVYC